VAQVNKLMAQLCGRTLKQGKAEQSKAEQSNRKNGSKL
jgi:hypothetical protein